MRLQLLMYYFNCETDEEGEKFFKFSKRHGTGYGKPGFPECTESMDIQDYLGPDSIGFFTTLGLDLNFLHHEADTWEELESYQEARTAVKHLKVVNDAAERGVKLTADFMGVAKREDRFQGILQVVENDRKLVPNQRKRHVRILNINK